MDSVKARAVGALLTFLLIVGLSFWFYRTPKEPPQPEDVVATIDGQWLEHLHSQNPRVAEEAARQLEQLGPSALPEIRAALQDPAADTARRKAALKAAGLLGTNAAAAVPDVAAHLANPELTQEAAVALSFMGPDAYAPLKQATKSEDPVVRREALRSLGKLYGRAPLDSDVVMPLLLQGLADTDPGVRVVSATYLGIIHDDGPVVVPALIETLQDEETEVRAAAATALGSFESEAATVIPALRKAAGDRDEEVARAAALALVKLQSNSRR